MIKFILEDPQAKNMDNLVKNLSNSYYCLGNLYKEDCNYQESLKYYILALTTLPQTEYKDSIFKTINDLFYVFPESFY